LKDKNMTGKEKLKRLLSSLQVFCIILLLSAVNAEAGSIHSKLYKIIQNSGPSEEIPVIITFSGKADPDLIGDKDKKARRSKMIRELRARAEVSERELAGVLKAGNVKNIRRLWLINSLAAAIPAQLIAGLADFPGVESIRPDYLVKAPQTVYGTAAPAEWNISAIKAPDVWGLGFTGAGVTIADMDTGVDIKHAELMDRWRGGTNSWYDPNGEHSSPYDKDGHGTQTMGIILGGSAGGSAIGVAPGAKWVGVKIFNDAGTATASVIHQGFQWCLDPDNDPATDDAPEIVNAAWAILDSTDKCIPEFQQDIQYLKAAGTGVVFAAGNAGVPSLPAANTSESPANNPGSFAVGAVDDGSEIASFSSRGPSACDDSIFPHVVAPGVNIRTADLTAGGVFPDAYVPVSGTSFASPHVAGAMALLIDAFPGSTIEEIEASLQESATDLGPTGGDNSYGYGLINVLNAYNLLLADNGPTPEIEIQPSSHDFGNATTGSSSAAVSVFVTGTGAGKLQVGIISLGGVDSASFRILADNCSGKTLGTGRSCSIDIVFAPLSAGAKEAFLSVTSNDPDAPVREISLKGTGLTPQPVAVISPNGGENWTAGTTRTIQWTHMENAGSFVKIELLKSGKRVSTIKSRISIGSGGHGSYTWTVPLKQKPGNDYRIRITNTTNKSYSDSGDSDFSISAPPPPSITVTSPDGGEIWQRGTARIISWTYEGKAGSAVRIRLLKGGLFHRNISSSAGIGTGGRGSFRWSLPAALPAGDDYQIQVVSKSKGSVNDTSNAAFVIE
jgi:serine protease AprX